MEVAYTRRIQFESQVHAVAIVEVLAQVFMGGGKEGQHDITSDGKVFKRVSTEEGMARMGAGL